MMFVCAIAHAGPLSPESVAATVLEGYKTGRYELSVSVMDAAEVKAFAENVRVVFSDRTSGDTNPMRAALFGGELTNQQLLAATDVDLMARFLDGYIKLLSGRSGAAPVQVTEYTVLGHIDEGSEMAHVLARVTAKDQSVSVTALRPFTVKKVNGEWRAQLDESAKAMLAKLRVDHERG
jgi:hypothetical protein